ncbi:MAG TPA: hypothetical protein VII09_01725 [Opitutaceae bacterium]
MKGYSQPLVECIARLLERDEREAVLGDLAETGESAWRASLQLAGLVVRRQAALWRDWRPWIAAFGLSLPSSLLLMGFSVSFCLGCQRFFEAALSPGASSASHGVALLAPRLIRLLAWSWTIGCVVGSLSRRTLWVSAAASCAPCLFCLERFRIESMSRFSLLLFVLPAIWGVRHGLRHGSPRMGTALAIAVAVTVLMVPAWYAGGSSGGDLRSWMVSSVLTWPAWFLVARARKPARAEATA